MNQVKTLTLFLTTLLVILGGCGGSLLQSPPPTASTVKQTGSGPAALEKVAEPTLSPDSGTYAADVTVTMACSTPGASIFYTADGSPPTTGSTPYTVPIAMTGNGTTKTLKAVAVRSGFADSNVAASVFIISVTQALPPQFSPTAGSYSSDQGVTITSTPGAAIYYTDDGSAPTTGSTPYTSPIAVAGNGTTRTIRAVAVKTGLADSTASAAYTINYSQASTPQFTPPAGAYASDQSVAIGSPTPGADLFYTTDGTAPTTASTPYTGPIAIVGNGTARTIRAIAVKSGFTPSSGASAAYTVQYPGSISVTLNPPSATPLVFSGTLATVQKGATMTVTTTFTASSYTWYQDFSSVPASTSPTYVVSTGSLGFGLHAVTLVVVSAGVSYSGSFSFQVTQ